MPPTLDPIDISPPVAEDDDDDDDNGVVVRNDALDLKKSAPCSIVPSTINPHAKNPPAASQETPKSYADWLVVDNITGNSFTVPGVVDGASSVNDIALFLRQTPTIFTDTSFANRVRNMNFATTNHLDTTQRHIHRIFTCLKCHPQLKFLADSIPDPEALDKVLPRLYLLVRGVPTDARMEVLNSVMCFFGESFFLMSCDGVDLTLLSPDQRAKVSRRIYSGQYCYSGITN